MTSMMVLVLTGFPGLWEWIIQLRDLPLIGMMQVFMSVPFWLHPTIRGFSSKASGSVPQRFRSLCAGDGDPSFGHS